MKRPPNTRALPAYAEYRPCELPVLEEIPAHWKVTRNSGLFQERRDKGHDELPVYSVTQARGVIPQDEVSVKVVRPSDNRTNYNRISPGDLVYNKMRMWQGAVGTAPAEAIVSPAYVVCQPLRPLVSRYYEYLFRTPLFITEAGRYSYGICDDMNSLRWNDFKAIQALEPPLPEQRAIANFLDRKTAEIDALLAEKQRLLELLEEKRTALITQAVTKGLDPDVEMKDSGVEWLGEIPADWSLTRLRFLTKFVTSGSRGWAQYYCDQGPTFIRIGNLRSVSIDLDFKDSQAVDPPSGGEAERSKVRPGDLLVSITALIGGVGVVPEGIGEAYVNQHVALVRLRQSAANSRWLAYCLLSRVGQMQFKRELYGGTKDGLSLDDVREVLVVLPPVQTQAKVVRYLDENLAALDDLTAEIKSGNTRLHEYRTALISAAVTGKIDVREEAA